MRRLQICLSLILVTTCLGQLGNVNLKPLPGMQFVNRTHRLGRGLVAYWPMNERSGVTVFDLSGNGNTGTFFGDLQWVPGKFGSVLFFNGVANYVSLGKTWADFIGADESTFVAWVKPTGIATENDSSYNGQSILGESGPTYIAFARCNVSGTDDKIWAMIFDGATKEVGVAYTNNAWNCVAMVHGSGVLSIYNNGIFGDSTACGSIADLSDTMRIGFGTVTWLGQISHILIYNRALSVGEIAELYKERDSWMFKRGDIELMAKSVAVPPAVVPTLYYYSSVPLVIIGYCFILGRKNAA